MNEAGTRTETPPKTIEAEQPYLYLLALRFALFNLVAAALLAATFLQGWLNGLFAENTRELAGMIMAVFLYGLVLCAVKVWRISVELNDVNAGAPKPDSRAGKYLAAIGRAGDERRSVHADALRLRLAAHVAIVRHVANSLVFLGLIGTVIGFIIALSGVDPAATTDVENVAPMVSTLIGGMAVALYTTLAGAVLYIWLIVDYRILATGAVDLIAATIELGESRGRP